MGLILLVGLIVKNGILLLDAAEALRRKGEAPREALVGAGRLRLRPILMTTLCTLAGLVPLALGLGAGAELQRPLALAVIGGLIVSTGVTLLLLPVGLEAVRALQVRGTAKAAGWSGLALVAILAGFPASRLEAQATDSAPTAPRGPHVIRWYEAAAAVGGVALLSVVDEPIQDWIQDHRSEGTDDAAGIFRREGEPIWWGGITVGVTAAGLIIGDDDVTRTGVRAITSVAASAVASTGIKYLLSRSRPAEGVGAFEFHPFSSLKDSDGTELRFSMPSGHTTAAFAVATTLADEIRSPVADVLLYTFATGTAWSRMNDDRHWLDGYRLRRDPRHHHGQGRQRPMANLQSPPAGLSGRKGRDGGAELAGVFLKSTNPPGWAALQRPTSASFTSSSGRSRRPRKWSCPSYPPTYATGLPARSASFASAAAGRRS